MPRAPRTSSELAELPTEATHPRAARLDTMPPEAIAALMLGEEAKAVRAAQARADDIGKAARLIADRLAGGRPADLRRRRDVGAPGHAGRGRVRADVRRAAVAAGADHRGRAGGADAFGRRRRGQRARGRAAHAPRGGRPGRRRLLRRRVGDDAVRARGAGLRALPARRDHLRAAAGRPNDDDDGVANVVIALETGPEVIAGSTRLKAGHRDEDHPQRDVDRRLRAAGQDLRRPDGRRAADQREAVGARDPHRAHAVRPRRRGGAPADREGGRAREGRAGHAPRGRQRHARQGAAGQAQGIAARHRRRRRPGDAASRHRRRPRTGNGAR